MEILGNNKVEEYIILLYTNFTTEGKSDPQAETQICLKTPFFQQALSFLYSEGESTLINQLPKTCSTVRIKKIAHI